MLAYQSPVLARVRSSSKPERSLSTAVVGFWTQYLFGPFDVTALEA